MSALDSVTLIWVIAHFCFLLRVYGHLTTLQAAEREYKAAAERYNAEARSVSNDNVRIAEAAEVMKAEKLRNATTYQQRKAAEAGAPPRFCQYACVLRTRKDTTDACVFQFGVVNAAARGVEGY